MGFEWDFHHPGITRTANFILMLSKMGGTGNMKIYNVGDSERLISTGNHAFIYIWLAANLADVLIMSNVHTTTCRELLNQL